MPSISSFYDPQMFDVSKLISGLFEIPGVKTVNDFRDEQRKRYAVDLQNKANDIKLGELEKSVGARDRELQRLRTELKPEDYEDVDKLLSVIQKSRIEEGDGSDLDSIISTALAKSKNDAVNNYRRDQLKDRDDAARVRALEVAARLHSSDPTITSGYLQQIPGLEGVDLSGIGQGKGKSKEFKPGAYINTTTEEWVPVLDEGQAKELESKGYIRAKKSIDELLAEPALTREKEQNIPTPSVETPAQNQESYINIILDSVLGGAKSLNPSNTLQGQETIIVRRKKGVPRG